MLSEFIVLVPSIILLWVLSSYAIAFRPIKIKIDDKSIVPTVDSTWSPCLLKNALCSRNTRKFFSVNSAAGRKGCTCNENVQGVNYWLPAAEQLSQWSKFDEEWMNDQITNTARSSE